MLFDKLKKDRIEAMKAKDDVRKNLLGVLIGDVTKTTKEPTDAECTQMIKKFITNIEKTLEFMTKMCLDSPNDELKKASLESEKEILESYLPKQLSEDGLRAAIKYAISDGNKDMGSIMKYLKANHEGRYDGKLASEITKEILSVC